MPPRTALRVTSMSRSSWRRKAQSKTFGSTAAGSRSWRPGASAAAGSARGSLMVRSAALVDAGRRDRVEDGADDRVGRDALRLTLEVADDAVAQRRPRHLAPGRGCPVGA